MPSRIPAISVQATVDGAIRYEGDTSREITQSEDDLGLDIFDISFLPGDPMRYGADPLGHTDSTAAFQAATDTGHPVLIPEGTFLVTGVTHMGKTTWIGGGEKTIIKSDSTVLTVTSGSGSLITGFRMENITAPWVITRNPNDWFAGIYATLAQSNGAGYQPTINDQDIWSASVFTASQTAASSTMVVSAITTGAVIVGATLTGTGITAGTYVVAQISGSQNGVGSYTVSNTVGFSSTTVTTAAVTTAQQNQDIGPKLFLVGNAEDIVVSNITGRFCQIELYDAIYSTVKNIRIRGGKGGAGSVVFWNINGQAGIGNRAENISVQYCSYSAVTFARNTDGYCLNVTADRGGESGVKFWKGIVAGVDARCYNMTLTACKANRMYFDGFDLCGDIPFDSTNRTSHSISNIEAYGCCGTGINIDGSGHSISNVKFWFCANKAWWGECSGSSISNLTIVGNNVANFAGNHEISESGGDNLFSNVTVTSNASGGHYAIYATGKNTWVNVRASGRPMFFGNIGSIVASLTNVSDDQTGADRLHNCEVSDHIVGLDERGTHFWPRRSTASIPAAAVTGVLADATSAHEYGQLHAYVGRNGALARVVRCLAESGSSAPTVHLSAPNTAPASANQDNGTFTFWLDESGSNIKFQVKYSTGTVKTGTLAVA